MDIREKLEVIAHLGDHITYREGIGICYDSALAKVIEDAYMTLKSGVTVQEWISVKDRLPDMYQNVLAIRADGKIVVDAIGSLEIWYKQMDIVGKPVTHWMPLPQPPKGE